MTSAVFTAAAVEVGASIADVLADEAMAWLHDPTRTAHRLVTAPTAHLVAEALADLPADPSTGAQLLPGRAWRVLPDRLLTLRPRRGDALERLRIPVPAHLEMTATVLEQWGWAKSGTRIRTRGGRRCILGAQRVVHALGYGTEDTATEAGRQIQGVLAGRGITLPYPRWNDLPGVTGRQVLAVVRQAAKEAS
jgi:hypothetical protein